jgi:predicted  nucleic acid-binding Zn-ribbon protein
MDESIYYTRDKIIEVLDSQLDEIENLISAYSKVIDETSSKKEDMKIVYEHLAASVHELKKQPEQQELDIEQTSDTEEKTESEENTE